MKSFWKLAAVIGLVLEFGCGFGRSETGQHIGFITNVSKSGWLCKTFEGQVNTGEGNSSIKYEFTIADEATARLLKEAMHDHKKVMLDYTSPLFYWACESEFSTIVTAAQLVN